MKEALIVFKIITIAALSLVFVLLLDYSLPARDIPDVVKDVLRGNEYSRRKSVYTHNLIFPEKERAFHVFRNDYRQFQKGDSILIQRSWILNEDLVIINTKSGYKTLPALGIYSYFSASIVLLFLCGGFGALYWNNPYKHGGVIAFTVFIIGIILFLIGYY